MIGDTELEERKAAILRAVVTEYIDTAQPVGSAHVLRAPGVSVSAATVRNEMSSLEYEGYLAQPHTSAGRVPTDKGYRFFVDQLIEPVSLEPGQHHQVRDFFAHAHGELEQMLHATSSLLSRLTDQAAVVVAPPHDVATIRSIQLVGMNRHVALLVVVCSDGAVDRRTLELADEVADEVDQDTLGAASAHLMAHLLGHSVSDPAILPLTGDAATDSLVAAAVAALRPSEEAELAFVGGAARMANAFAAVDTVRSVLEILEQQYVVVSLLRDVVDRGLTVSIGAENGLPPLAECAVVVARYDVEGSQAGSIGVLGPTRMNYPHALAAVAMVGERLGRYLSEG
ncbi:MAG: heat-inducible transcriptional repressor HrcA [Acidimicrobiales bacterium]